MRIIFDVGHSEHHEMEFFFDQILSGYARLRLDGQTVLRRIRPIALSRVQMYEVEVGDEEKHSVRIEKRKRLLFGGALPQRYTVFIDGNLLVTVRGY